MMTVKLGFRFPVLVVIAIVEEGFLGGVDDYDGAGMGGNENNRFSSVIDFSRIIRSFLKSCFK